MGITVNNMKNLKNIFVEISQSNIMRIFVNFYQLLTYTDDVDLNMKLLSLQVI